MKRGDVWQSGMTGKLALVRCPACDKENYAPNVLTGICTWCGYEAKPEDVTPERPIEAVPVRDHHE